MADTPQATPDLARGRRQGAERAKLTAQLLFPPGDNLSAFLAAMDQAKAEADD